jgi:replicative DNA helicase
MIDEERNIVACMFQDFYPEWTDLVIESVTEDMFTDRDCARIFATAYSAITTHGSAKISVLPSELAQDVSKWKRTISNPSASLSLVLGEFKRRKLTEYCYGAIEMVMKDNPDEILRHLQGRLDTLSMSIGGDPKLAQVYLNSLIEQVQNPKPFISTGIADFDAYMRGFQAGQMVVIAGRPGQGKSVLGTQIALTSAVQGRPALMFNFEMSGEEIVGRIIAGELGINSESIANRDLYPSQIEHMISRKDMLDGLPLFIDTKTSHNINSIRAIARKYKRQHNIGVLVVDYLQLIHEDKDRTENREQVVARMSRSFKVLAKELEIPVIILSQLSRESDKRATKEPQLSDLRESGAIEQDADIVMFTHRPETHGIDTFEDGSSTAGMMLLKVAKRRNGRTATLRLRFNAKDQRIEDGGQVHESY